jgi:hypothetical protein
MKVTEGSTVGCGEKATVGSAPEAASEGVGASEMPSEGLSTCDGKEGLRTGLCVAVACHPVTSGCQTQKVKLPTSSSTPLIAIRSISP